MSDFAKLLEMAMESDPPAARKVMGPNEEPEEDKKAEAKPAEHKPAEHHAPAAPVRR